MNAITNTRKNDKKTMKLVAAGAPQPIPAPPPPHLASGPRSWKNTFSSEEQKLLAKWAEEKTNLKARELFMVVGKAPKTLFIFPDEATFRCQLGRVTRERKCQPNLEGVCDAYDGIEEVFELVAYGPSWEEAVRNYHRRQGSR